MRTAVSGFLASQSASRSELRRTCYFPAAKGSALSRNSSEWPGGHFADIYAMTDELADVAHARALLDTGQSQEAFAILDPLIREKCAPAMTLMASALSLGLGVAIDGPKAIQLYEHAAVLGDGLAAHNLGTLLLTGMPGVQVNKQAAFKWFERARQLGCTLMPVMEDNT